MPNTKEQDILSATKTASHWLVMVQEGEGCDHSIGCGVVVIAIGASSDEEAHQVAAKNIEEYGCLSRDGERRLAAALVFRGQPTALDVRRMESSRREAEREHEQKIQQEQERLQYEALKAKFGN